MPNYASVTDVELGWRALSYGEKQNAEMLLTVASKWIADRKAIPVGDPTAKYVVVDVVRSALRMAKYAGLTSFSRTVGNVSQSGTVANPSKTGSVAIEFTDWHKDLLGIARDGQAPKYRFGDE